MQGSRIITEHEQSKKEILVLPPDQLKLLITLALNKFTASTHDLYHLLRTASERNPGLGVWTLAKTERHLKALADTPFAYETYRGVSIDQDWRNLAIFCSDAIRPEQLKVIIQAINVLHRYPSGGDPGSNWSLRYEDIGQRCIHKILLNDHESFHRLYQQLVVTQTYYAHAQQQAQAKVDRVLATIDWNFWKTRHNYFQWTAFAEQQYAYSSWTQRTPANLERMIIPLHQEIEPGDCPEETRAIALLGFHYFKDRAELFSSFDPGLEAICFLAKNNLPAAEASFSKLPPRQGEESVGIVDVIQAAFAYGQQKISIVELRLRASAFQQSEYPAMINCFLAFTFLEHGDRNRGEELLEQQFTNGLIHPLEWMVGLWCAAWMGVKLRQAPLQNLYLALEKGLYKSIPWVEKEIVYALQTLFPHQEVVVQGDVQAARTQVQAEDSFLHLLPIRPIWEFALRQLLRTGSKASQEKEETTAYRTIWIIDFESQAAYCKEQKMGKRGWTKGRRLKWYELIAPKHPASMDPADTKAISALSTHDGRRLSSAMLYNDDALQLDFGRLLYEIADHPRILLGEDRRIPVELLRAQPELRVTEAPGGNILLQFIPDVEVEGYVWKKETPTRYRIYCLSEDQARMAWAIGSGVEVPNQERDRLEDMVEDLRPSVNVQSSFDLINEDLATVYGSPLPCFHLLPFGDGYKVELYVKPLPGAPYYFKPGEGMARSIIVLEDGRHILERPLALEMEEATATISRCPTLKASPQTAYEWAIEDTQSALRILLELRALLAEQLISIEHPKGEKLRIVGQAGSDELAIRVGKQRDWFEVNGKLTVSEDKVLDLALLLEQLKLNDNPFIELAEGEFVALTEELKDRILEMEGLLHRKGNKFQLPTLAASAFSELAEDLEDLEFDDAWTQSLQRISSAQNIRPRVPKDFKAELRDYQKEGFRWLMRLAEWGVGGCLADDMGLGKTIQALAVLTARADKGPSLVIAPASVTRNWLRETERFAPGLIPILIASRQDIAILPQLSTGDLALVSYGLLPFIGEELAEIEFANIVIDEAQAIKNAATKRAKVVQSLQGDFKLATTGTPIENHLGELWSLFRFLNPGLLSSKSAFNEKYNKPIARDGDEGRRNALKRLVKPFILRRRKDEVLTELPPKTEIVLNVALSEEEKALYEALRRQAVKEIAQADEQQKRFTVLAQLTKLRQAACHPRLVRPTSKLGSAKLELVGETLLELLESGHKALIFSQFVKHLKIVENWVKGQGIAYQYLDGSTPGKKREEAVNAFQAGDGQVFLISLKAGGTGLNLTAADYVLHLDPWWNPAVEDQASDRAHRIGQQRPVTVYRFVSEGTIEEQIIALHAEKRDLADQILAGTGNAGKLGVEEILELIREA